MSADDVEMLGASQKQEVTSQGFALASRRGVIEELGV
jgi:hypothetical protein